MEASLRVRCLEVSVSSNDVKDRRPDECCEGNCKVGIGCHHDHCTGPGTVGPTPAGWTEDNEKARIKLLKQLDRFYE
jgi:hypothetical protein